MNTSRSSPAHISHVLLQIVLRLFALVGSLFLIAVLCALFVFADLSKFTPWMLEEIAARSDGSISFDHVELGFQEALLTIEIEGLSVKRDLVNGPLDFSAKSALVRMGSPVIGGNGVQIDHIGVVNPQVKFTFSADDDMKQVQQDRSADISLSMLGGKFLLPEVRTISVSDGSFDLVLDSEKVDVNALGQFSLDGNYTDDVFSIVGRFDSTLHNESEITYRLDRFESSADKTITKLELDIQSLDAAWLGAVWAIVGTGKRGVDPAALTAVIDAGMTGRLVDDQLETVDWKLEISDPLLDGSIPDSKNTVVKSAGSWRIDENGSGKIETQFELSNLDTRVLLNRYPNAFPPKFYAHMIERLDSLWVRRVSGSFVGNPDRVMRDKDLTGLTVDGSFQKMDFLYGKKWPRLVDGSGSFAVRGKKLDITGKHGVIYGEKVGSVTASIGDFTLADPVMYLSAEMDVPMPVVFDLFGPNGIVLPGKTKGITSGRGAGNISMTVAVPLRRGKEFLIDGVASPGDMSVMTEYGVEVSDIRGHVNFDRIGITSGKLTADALGGEFETQISGSGTKGNYAVAGSSRGTSRAEALVSFVGSSLGSQLNGNFDWQADFDFKPNENTIAFTSSLTGIDSDLPFPLNKSPDLPVQLAVDVRTVNGNERSIDFDLASIAQGELESSLINRSWHVHTGTVSIGDIGRPVPDSEGVHVAISLPEFDYDAWSYLIKQNDAESNLRFDSLARLEARANAVNIARGRQLKNVDVTVQKQEDAWQIDISSEEVVGEARLRNTDFLQEGELPTLVVQLSKCHVPEAQSEPSDRAVNPRNVPNLDFTCADTRYGQYHLGKSVILARATDDSWRIEKAVFSTPALVLDASGDWNYEQSSNLRFSFNSADFGKSMDQLGYSGMFEGGKINLSGYLNWNDALTKWKPNLTSGEIGFVANDGTVTNVANNPSNTVVGLLNYDTLLQRMSVDVSDVLKGGLAYHDLAGKMTVTDGTIEVEGVYMDSPSVAMAVQGSTDWVSKEHNLMAGVESKIGKSLTTITTLINPIQGLFTYLAQELLENMDIDLFTLQYQIGGTWDEPQIIEVDRRILSQNNANDVQ